MCSALHYIFKKNVLIVFIILLLFLATKFFTVYNLMKDKDNQSELNEWVKQCSNMEDDEIEIFISSLSTELSENFDVEEDVINNFTQFVSSFENVKSINRLIDFAENKEGVVPTALPNNYMKLLHFYKDLEKPQIINKTILDNYFELQTYNTVVLIVIMLTAIFWGQHYEIETYKYVITTPKGKKYNQTIRTVLLVVSYLFLFINEIIDLYYSGIIKNPQIFPASMQSYSAFNYAQDSINIQMCFAIMYISKIITVFCVCTCVELVARSKKNMRDTLINCFCILLIIFFVKQGMTNTGYFSFVQIGLVDWKETIAKSVQIMERNVSTLVLGVVLSFATGGILGGLITIKSSKKYGN